jgi:hypothetical protein
MAPFRQLPEVRRRIHVKQGAGIRDRDQEQPVAKPVYHRPCAILSCQEFQIRAKIGSKQYGVACSG